MIEQEKHLNAHELSDEALSSAVGGHHVNIDNLLFWAKQMGPEYVAVAKAYQKNPKIKFLGEERNLFYSLLLRYGVLQA